MGQSAAICRTNLGLIYYFKSKFRRRMRVVRKTKNKEHESIRTTYSPVHGTAI